MQLASLVHAWNQVTVEQIMELYSNQTEMVSELKEDLLEAVEGFPVLPPHSETYAHAQHELRTAVLEGFRKIQDEQLRRILQIAGANKERRVVVFFRVVQYADMTEILYEYHERGGGISAINFAFEEMTKAPEEYILDRVRVAFKIRAEDYVVLEWEDPDDWDGEPLNKQLIVNPSEEDDY